MCTCSMRIACKPGSEVPEHLNLSRTPAPFLSARLTQSRVVCVFACLSRPSTGTLTPPPPTNDAGAGRDLIREADREPVPAVAKQHGVSEQTIYTWRKRFGGFQANDVRRLKQLEAENARLKKLVAERDLEIEVMKEVASKNW
jgi:putative transposase